jgi:multidrug efflux pump subunit AcrA (membrane-fusion protein)
MKKFTETVLEQELNKDIFNSVKNIYQINRRSAGKWWFWGSLVIIIIIMFLPWTQNIRAKGYITTLFQDQRPQSVYALIPGRVEKWYVKEGDFVKKGDTLMRLGEVKVEYFDPTLLARTRQQIDAKNLSIGAYEDKANTATAQTVAIENAKKLKLSSIDNKIGQQKLKILSDSAEVAATKNAFLAYQRQFEAAKTMYDNGAISLTEFEKRRINYQEGSAKVNYYENQLAQNKQELLNLRIEKNQVEQEYLDKILKAQGERFGSISAATSTSSEVFKLENQLSNYDIRQQYYFVTAPQDGQINKVAKAGIGEILKEAEILAEIVPQNVTKAVELFVDPLDLPLLNLGQKVRFIFDGFPAIVFSGWPKGSYGTFGGKVTAIESSVSSNGKFRILVSEDPLDNPWPIALKMGGGANGILLIKDVPIYYELWRNINGFPPDYYTTDMAKKPSK